MVTALAFSGELFLLEAINAVEPQHFSEIIKKDIPEPLSIGFKSRNSPEVGFNPALELVLVLSLCPVNGVHGISRYFGNLHGAVPALPAESSDGVIPFRIPVGIIFNFDIEINLNEAAVPGAEIFPFIWFQNHRPGAPFYGGFVQIFRDIRS